MVRNTQSGTLVAHDNPNHKICLRCGKKQNTDTGMMLGGMG
jgi:hypothetical protein